MEVLTIVATVIAITATCVGGFLAYIVLRIRVENQNAREGVEKGVYQSLNLMRREVTEQLQELRRELAEIVKERLEGMENEVERVRDRLHDINNKLQGVAMWIEQSRSNHERLRSLEDRVRDLERSAPHRRTDVT